MEFALGIKGEQVRADNLSDLVSALIPEYPQALDAGPAEQLISRADFCAAAAADAQARICYRWQEQDPETFDALTEAELTALFADRRTPLFLPYLDLAEEWTHSIPLVLVRTDYAPFTSWPAPTGNVMMVDPYTERTLLVSISGIRELDISLFVNEDD